MTHDPAPRPTTGPFASDRPHAYDPVAQPHLFEGVLGRRVMAFLVDATIILALTVLAYVLLGVLGILTLGLAWFLIPLAFPVVALGYSALTLGGPSSATVGMRLMGLEMRTWYGSRMYALLAVFHTLVFYFSVSILTPFILLLSLFNDRKRCLHDFVSGAVVINSGVAPSAARRP